jgi:hypothetical protein
VRARIRYVLGAVLSHEDIVRWACAPPLRAGVLSGDVVLYWVGRHWGEQVLNLRLVRLVLTVGPKNEISRIACSPVSRGGVRSPLQQ